GAARVALLMHTYLGPDVETARRVAARPLQDYLRTSFELTRRLVEARGSEIDFARLPPADLDRLLARAAERFMIDHSLIGTAESCQPLLARLAAIGVTEIGCLIDFGVDPRAMLDSLPRLVAMRDRAAAGGLAARTPALGAAAPAAAVRGQPTSEAQ